MDFRDRIFKCNIELSFQRKSGFINLFKCKVMQTYKYFLWLCLSVFILSCSNEKEQLINEYKAVQKLIKDANYDSLYLQLDRRSLEYIDFVTDTVNLNYENLKSIGNQEKLTLFTLVYNSQIGFMLNEDVKTNIEVFFNYLKISGVPMFNVLSEQKILEDQTEASGKQNYVVVGTKVNKNTFISSKIRFSKTPDRYYKLNLLSLLKMREKILNQQFKQYKRSLSYEEKKNLNTADEYLKKFLEDRHLPENRLKEIRYRK